MMKRIVALLLAVMMILSMTFVSAEMWEEDEAEDETSGAAFDEDWDEDEDDDDGLEPLSEEELL